MNDLLERLERMGRAGGLLGLGLAVVFLLAAFGLAFEATEGFTELQGLIANPEADAPEGTLRRRWVRRSLVAAATLSVAMALPAALIGVRLLTQRHYPSASEVFPRMSVREIEAALEHRTEEQCVCTRCQVMVPAAFSTGSCPVCASSVEYHEVRDDEDVKIVVAAMS